MIMSHRCSSNRKSTEELLKLSLRNRSEVMSWGLNRTRKITLSWVRSMFFQSLSTTKKYRARLLKSLLDSAHEQNLSTSGNKLLNRWVSNHKTRWTLASNSWTRMLFKITLLLLSKDLTLKTILTMARFKEITIRTVKFVMVLVQIEVVETLL